MPLLLIGIGIITSQQDEPTDHEVSSPRDRSLNKRQPSVLRSQSTSSHTTHQSKKSAPTDQLILDSPFAQKTSSPTEQNSSRGHRAAILAQNSPRFTQTWEKIDPKIIALLTPSAQDDLADHLDTLTTEEADKHYLCWTPGTSPELVMAYHAAEEAAGLNYSAQASSNDVSIKADQFLGAGKWTRVASDSLFHGSTGGPVTITWSIVPDNTQVANGSGGNSASNFRSWISGIYGGNAAGIPSEQPWFELISAAFNDMADQCGINFIYESNDDGATMSSNTSGEGRLGVRGDIRIGANFVDGSGDPENGGSVLAFAYAPNFGDIIFDSADPFFENTSNSSIRFHNVMAHELGHAIGLAHVCPINRTKLMEPTVTTSFRGPQFDETYSLQRQYGDPWERLGGSTANEFANQASFLNLTDDESRLIRWVSIDNANDQDHFRFTSEQFQKLTVVVSPQTNSYLEGAQLSSGCTSGTNFSPSTQQNLTLEVLATDGNTVLASSTDGAIGEGESIIDLEFENEGTHYIRVAGDNTDSAQLYSLTILLGGAPPTPNVVFASNNLVAESGSVKNGRPDPGETILVDLSLVNVGTKISSNLKVDLTIPDGMTSNATQLSFADPEPGATSSQPLTFMFTGQCGQVYQIPGVISDESGEQSRFTLNYRLGLLEEGDPYREDFDDSLILPAGWTQTITGAGEDWRVVTDESWSAPHSIFAPGVPAISTSTLTTPSIPLGAANNRLRFAHFYDFELRWDGGVLEASLEDGDWFDLPTHPDVIVETGGYSPTLISSLSSNPLKGRSSWTGSNGGLALTEFDLPDSWGTQNIRFRWISGYDRSVSENGWYLDRFNLERDFAICEPHRPAVTLSTTGELNLIEGNTQSTITASIELPIATDLNIPLTFAGTASADDFSGEITLTIPARATSAQSSFSANADDLREGSETLIISLPEDDASFAAPGNTPLTFTITESENFSSWAAQNLPHGATPNDDSDLDGLNNLGEYLLGTSPTDPTSTHRLHVKLLETELHIPIPPLPERSDGQIRVERSADLQTWTTVIPTLTRDSLQIPRDDHTRYLRLNFSLNE